MTSLLSRHQDNEQTNSTKTNNNNHNNNNNNVNSNGGSSLAELASNENGGGNTSGKEQQQQTAEEVQKVEEVLSSLKVIDDDLKQAQELVKEFNKLMQKTTELQDKVKTLSLRTGRQLSIVNKHAKELHSEELDGSIRHLKRRLGRLREIRPETRSFFSRMMLGRVNVKCFSDRERVRLRDEYNKFKVRTNVLYILFPLVVLLFHYYLRHEWLDTHWINIFHHLWLLYYWVSLALRENILLVNGSNIRPWWIYHHYLSALGTMVWLVWPLTDLYLSFVPYVTCLCFYTGIVQAMQILFYSKRDYANRALGKTGHMDVTYPETITELPKELLVLIPFLFAAHIWQMVLGLMFLRTLFKENLFGKHWTEFREELQILFSGLFSFVLGLGNFIMTVYTVYSKANKKRSVEGEMADKESLAHVLKGDVSAKAIVEYKNQQVVMDPTKTKQQKKRD